MKNLSKLLSRTFGNHDDDGKNRSLLGSFQVRRRRGSPPPLLTKCSSEDTTKILPCDDWDLQQVDRYIEESLEAFWDGGDAKNDSQALRRFKETMNALPRKRWRTGKPDWEKCRSDEDLWKKLMYQIIEVFGDMVERLPQKDGKPDWERCRSDEDRWKKLKTNVQMTNETIVAPLYDDVWRQYEPHDRLLKNIEECNDKFQAYGKPRCDIENFMKRKFDASGKGKRSLELLFIPKKEKTIADIRAILYLASEHGLSFHQAIEKAVRDTGGAYNPGPRKGYDRFLEKAITKYGGDACRVNDIERGTGLYDSSDDLAKAVSHLSNKGGLNIVYVKDAITDLKHDSHYRDIKFYVEINGLIGELQLSLRRIKDLNPLMHRVYEIDRVVNNRKYHEVQPHEGGLVSVPMLRLTTRDETFSFSYPGCLEKLQERLKTALPPGCVYAAAYVLDNAMIVWLGVKSFAALATLRDNVLLEKEFKKKLAPYEINIGSFVDFCATNMMKFVELTPHQEEKLQEIQDAPIALLLAPAGGGKTFVAVQRMLTLIQQDKTVLFVARNSALALYAVRWLVIASRKSAETVVKRVRVLINSDDISFSDGPRFVQAVDEDKHQSLRIGKADNGSAYRLVIVDEAHHVAGHEGLREQLRKFMGPRCGFLFLSDISQGSTEETVTKENVREILELPKSQEIVVAELHEVIRSTKRIVKGAAAFQLAAALRSETKTHSSSIGPALEPYLFAKVPNDERYKKYAENVVKALKSVEGKLDGVNLDNRVMIICPNEKFVENLRDCLKKELRLWMPHQYKLVSALQGSAALPQNTFGAATNGPRWLVFDSIDHVDGLERLIVVGVGLDNEIENPKSDFQTRSALYRALTRAQLVVAVVNEYVQGGWLAFLGKVRFESKYDDSIETLRLSDAPADKVLERNVPSKNRAHDKMNEENSLEPTSKMPEKAKQQSFPIQSIWNTEDVAKDMKDKSTPIFNPFKRFEREAVTSHHLDAAIEAGDWAAVGAIAARLAASEPSKSEQETGTRSRSGSTSSLDVDRAAELDRLVDAGDWEGVVAAAANFEHNKNDESLPSGGSNAGSNAKVTGQTARQEYRATVQDLIQRVVPEEMPNIDAMMLQFRGREHELVETLQTMQERAVAQKARKEAQRAAKEKAKMSLTASKTQRLEEVENPVENPVGAQKQNKTALEAAIEAGDWDAVGEAAVLLSDELTFEELEELIAAGNSTGVTQASSNKRTSAVEKTDSKETRRRLLQEEQEALAQAEIWTAIAEQSKQEAKMTDQGAADAADWAISRSLSALQEAESNKMK